MGGPGGRLCTGPFGHSSNHLHIWRNLLEQAGFTLTDIPHEWDAFWWFWCDRVQPAVREATGRDDIWAVGLPMGPATDGWTQFMQFVVANDAAYVTPNGRLVIDEPEVRSRLVRVMDSYAAIYRKGCTPPDALSWSNYHNNEAFLAQRVVMTPNPTLSIPNALKPERAHDYHRNTATIEWPLGPGGEPFPIETVSLPAMALPQLFRRAPAPVDSCPPRSARLARRDRPTPHGCGHPGGITSGELQLRRRLGERGA